MKACEENEGEDDWSRLLHKKYAIKKECDESGGRAHENQEFCLDNHHWWQIFWRD